MAHRLRENVNTFLQPHVLVPVLMTAACLLSVAIGMGLQRRRVKFVERRVIPPELSRLAAVFQISEDIPKTQSYGHKMHLLFDEKEDELRQARDAIADLVEENDHLNEAIDGLAEQIATWQGDEDDVAVFGWSQDLLTQTVTFGTFSLRYEHEPFGSTLDELACIAPVTTSVGASFWVSDQGGLYRVATSQAIGNVHGLAPGYYA